MTRRSKVADEYREPLGEEALAKVDTQCLGQCHPRECLALAADLWRGVDDCLGPDKGPLAEADHRALLGESAARLLRDLAAYVEAGEAEQMGIGQPGYGCWFELRRARALLDGYRRRT